MSGNRFVGWLALVFVLSACSQGPAGVPQTTTGLPPAETLAPTFPPSPSPAPTALPVEVKSDVPYVVDGDFKQKLDVYVPGAGEGPFPTLLAIHGGGASKQSLSDLASYFAEQGYAVIAINYREMPYDVYPFPVQDVFCALAWAHEHAGSYGFDPERIAALGHSSGGTLAALLGVVDDPALYLADCPHTLPEAGWVQAVVPFTGIFDFVVAAGYSEGMHDYVVDYLGGELGQVPGVWAEASPVTWVDGTEPPFLLIHGAADVNIPPDESAGFARVLEDAGVDVELLLVPDADHGEVVRSESCFQAVADFLLGLGFSQ